MGEPLAELHSTIISRDVAAKTNVRKRKNRESGSAGFSDALGAAGNRREVASGFDDQFSASLTMHPRTKTSSTAATIRFSG
jgi:hypothetical protein